MVSGAKMKLSTFGRPAFVGAFIFSLNIVSLSTSAATVTDTITYQFTGSITRLAPMLEEQFSTNDLLFGSFDVETTGTQQFTRTIYPASNLSVTIGNDYFVSGTTGSMIISKSSTFGDGITASFSNSSGTRVFGEPVNGSSPGYFDIQLDWFGGGILSSQALPAFAPVNTGESDRSNINFPSDSERLSYKLTSMTVVPVPAAAWLFGSALFGLIGLYRKK